MKKKKTNKYDLKYTDPEANPELNKDLEQENEIKSVDDLDIIHDDEKENPMSQDTEPVITNAE